MNKTIKNPHFLVHNHQDSVGVAVVEDIKKGRKLTRWVMETDETITVTARDAVPIGHKVALMDIKKGDHVHVHNTYQEVIERHKTSDLSESQPTKGNIEGGLTTFEAKAFGNLEKIGKKTKYIDVLKPAEAPRKGPGLYFKDTSSAAAECVTLQAAAGFTVHVFPTGQGNVIGNPIEPVIKLTANLRTTREMSEHIDLDVSGILRREMNYDEADDALIDIVIRTCNGRLTCAQALGHREFVMTKLYQSA